ncbi:sigma 54-interacting transcriptional regulator [Vagococcus sp. BWB3-3]|uniref:Sigma 54-interacting transcriptional regulator n=1 Tax=Vagococcus allomyrinae TaxID=2794353 RepID=A0A940SUQ0_9ENTE|nr:sigma 54-interacting transcriptional regulator [Vagococcus allomyrinae]MBP1039568.1 sigma 54-interacting transcriptional regulator [Vagococcus allomyrinae]
MSITRKKYIFHKLYTLSETVVKLNIDEPIGWTAKELADVTGYSRSNVSRELNVLHKEAQIIKIGGRPVRFICRANEYLAPIGTVLFFDNQNQFKSLFSLTPPATIDLASSQELENQSLTQISDSFASLIGFDKSMKNQVKQAIAAILYPPKGLDTLLIGETGVGKTTFANTMYQFAVESEKLKSDAPYIIFNCADYAGNPQLLLSHLFGHVRGAFTGADTDRKGLVAQANNGILFLDEVHRLPPEGQEMLFSLIDRGEYRRLGESNMIHYANVLIISATTEQVDVSILQTFLRRIPNLIAIPPLRERTLEERMELIMLNFKQEAKKINHPIKVSNEVMKYFLVYECKHNIGQLCNDIQLICASAFVEMLTKKTEEVNVKLSQLPSQYVEYFDIFDEKRDILSHEFYWSNKRGFTFHPTDSSKQVKNFFVDKTLEENLYATIEATSKQYFQQGLELDEVTHLVDKELVNYFSQKSQHNLPELPSEEPIYKLVSKEDYSLINSILLSVLSEYGITVQENTIIGIILHLVALIERIYDNQPRKPKSELVVNNDAVYYTMAKQIILLIEESKAIQIPAYEIGFIAVFLESLTLKSNDQRVGILVITHGQVAEELAKVANILLKVEQAHYLCLPLDEKVSIVLAAAKELVKEIDQGKGVLLLVDMGSLTTFGEIIAQETGVAVKSINMVSTLTVLEATRLSLMASTTLESLVESLENISDYPIPSRQLETSFSTQTHNYIDNPKLVTLIQNVLTFIDSRKAIETLTETFHQIIEQLTIENTNALYIKYIFHTTCMLERVIQNETYSYKDLKTRLYDYQSIHQTVVNNFQYIDNVWGIEIPESELAYVTEIFIFSEKNIFEKIVNGSTH